jgi:ankyrin repeat protein
MPNRTLPERPSLSFLRKLAKERLLELRRADPRAQLAAAQLAVAREHGFPSWRALTAEVDRRRAPVAGAFFVACRAGDAAAARALLAADPTLARERDDAGQTGLHVAAAHPEVLRALLDGGADVDARDAGDHATALHVAAGGGHLDSARVLLDAGADPHGAGDAHRLEVIGWATCFHDVVREDVVALLVQRGARHHVFSAIAAGDLEALGRLVEANPEALGRRMSRFEHGATALHFAVAPPDGLRGLPVGTAHRHAALAALVELGVALDAEDDRRRTALEIALLHGDAEAARILRDAGAREPRPRAAPVELAPLAASIRKLTPMLRVRDVGAALAWYRALGFAVDATHEEHGVPDWARLSFGGAELMLSAGGVAGPHDDVTLWLASDRLDELHRALVARQLGGDPAAPPVRFVEDLHHTHYGSRELTILDLDGYRLAFIEVRP